MKLNEILTEHVINAFDPDLKHKYSDQVWEILQKSYSSVPGGFATASSVDELIEKSGLWKFVIRNKQITAIQVYKDHFGRKSIASGTDGTPEGKKDLMMIANADIKFNRSWAEVSGAPELLLKRARSKPLPAKFAELLTGKEILSYSDDGYHYTRLIGGHPHEKIIYGSVNMSPELENQLTKMGISVNDLPSNFKKT
jgi:hypothetical protein